MPDASRIKCAIKQALPAPARRQIKRGLSQVRQSAIVERLRQRREFNADAARYARHADLCELASRTRTPIQLEAQLTRDYHRVEKGLTLARPKRPFGSEVLARLDALIPRASEAGPKAPFLEAAKSAREALIVWNSGGEADEIVAPVAESPDRGAGVAQFFATRHSVRDFSEDSVSRQDICRAIELAAFSPSVCNREPWGVRLFFGDDVPKVLAYQNGNLGFTNCIPAVALISVELGLFVGAGERNQAWIEGGIFASSMVWALHGIGLESCMLNLSITTEVADRLRAAVGMAPSEVPIVMIAVGYGRSGHRVARSPRRSAANLILGEGLEGRVMEKS